MQADVDVIIKTSVCSNHLGSWRAIRRSKSHASSLHIACPCTSNNSASSRHKNGASTYASESTAFKRIKHEGQCHTVWMTKHSPRHRFYTLPGVAWPLSQLGEGLGHQYIKTSCFSKIIWNPSQNHCSRKEKVPKNEASKLYSDASLSLSFSSVNVHFS